MLYYSKYIVLYYILLYYILLYYISIYAVVGFRVLGLGLKHIPSGGIRGCYVSGSPFVDWGGGSTDQTCKPYTLNP